MNAFASVSACSYLMLLVLRCCMPLLTVQGMAPLQLYSAEHIAMNSARYTAIVSSTSSAVMPRACCQYAIPEQSEQSAGIHSKKKRR
jgi:hypothetical protein